MSAVAKKAKLLLMGRDTILQTTRSAVLQSHGYEVTLARNLPEAEQRLATSDLVLVCHSFGNADSQAIADYLRQARPGVELLLMDEARLYTAEALLQEVDTVLTRQKRAAQA